MNDVGNAIPAICVLPVAHSVGSGMGSLAIVIPTRVHYFPRLQASGTLQCGTNMAITFLMEQLPQVLREMYCGRCCPLSVVGANETKPCTDSPVQQLYGRYGSELGQIP